MVTKLLRSDAVCTTPTPVTAPRSNSLLATPLGATASSCPRTLRVLGQRPLGSFRSPILLQRRSDLQGKNDLKGTQCETLAGRAWMILSSRDLRSLMKVEARGISWLSGDAAFRQNLSLVLGSTARAALMPAWNCLVLRTTTGTLKPAQNVWTRWRGH